MEETWEPWHPLLLLPKGRCVLENIRYVNDTLQFFAVNKHDYKKIRVIFDDPMTYRLTDETYRMQTIETWNKKHSQEFYAFWTFFKVQNSLYIKNFIEKLSIINNKLIHYSFITSDSILDVISSKDPLFEIKIEDQLKSN